MSNQPWNNVQANQPFGGQPSGRVPQKPSRNKGLLIALVGVIVVAVALGVALITTLTGNAQRAEQAGTAAATTKPASDETREQGADENSTKEAVSSEASEEKSPAGEETSSSEANSTSGGSGTKPAFPTSFGDYNLSGPADKVSAQYTSPTSALEFSVAYTDTESTYDIWLGRMRDVQTIGGLKCGEMTPDVPQCIAKVHGGAINAHLSDSFEEKSTHEEVAKRTQEFLKAWN